MNPLFDLHIYSYDFICKSLFLYFIFIKNTHIFQIDSAKPYSCISSSSVTLSFYLEKSLNYKFPTISYLKAPRHLIGYEKHKPLYTPYSPFERTPSDNKVSSLPLYQSFI